MTDILIPEIVPPRAALSHMAGDHMVGRQELIGLPIPDATRTHVPVSHASLVEALIQSLGYRNIQVVNDEYALSPDYMRMFGVMTVNVDYAGVRLALGIRNSHDKSFSLGITIGYKVFVCSNLMFNGDFQALAQKKHTKNFDLIETVALAVERMQRGFDPMKRQIDAWQDHSLTDSTAKSIICDAFAGGMLEAPKHLDRVVYDHYFQPRYPDFESRTLWSLQNAFTSAFKELDPMKAIPLTAKLPAFLEQF